MSMKKIGMVVAVEIQSVLKRYMDRLVEEQGTGLKVYSLDLGDKKLYITQSGAGEIKAAAATQKLISEFGVDMIVNYGVVGALVDELKVTHTCVVDRVVHYDFDTSAYDNCEVGRYIEYDDIYLHTTPKYVELAKEYDVSIIQATCASADKFVAEADRKRELHDRFDASICDMESAAIVLVCDMNNVPNLLIKTVSDSITGGAEEFGERLEEAADACFDIMDRIVREI